MGEHRDEPTQGRGRIGVVDLSYPVLVLQKDRFDVWRDAQSAIVRKGLLVDSRGLSYQVVDVENADPFFRDGRTLPREERRRLIQRGLTPTAIILYKGDPVQLSLEDVRQKIVWLVSARGHFEIPQGLPSAVSLVESVEELFGVLLATRFR